MTVVSPKITEAAWRVVPGPLRRRLRTQGGRRLIRFAPAAVLALCATQLTYLICQLAHVTAGLAGAVGWLAGAAVSYVVSRWAWERKGRPDLLRETLPFWMISLCVGVVLTLTSKVAHAEARTLGLHRFERHPGFPQPGQAGMPQLVTGRAGKPCPRACAVEDFIQPGSRQRQTAARALQHREHPVSGGPGRALRI